MDPEKNSPSEGENNDLSVNKKTLIDSLEADFKEREEIAKSVRTHLRNDEHAAEIARENAKKLKEDQEEIKKLPEEVVDLFFADVLAKTKYDGNVDSATLRVRSLKDLGIAQGEKTVISMNNKDNKKLPHGVVARALANPGTYSYQEHPVAGLQVIVVELPKSE